MTLDEHLIVYWVHKFDQTGVTRQIKGQMGTREQIQTKLLEFIFNLKYYSTRWLRAKTYAEMLGFYMEGMDSHSTPLT